MAIPKVIFTESFQHLDVATYPIMNGGYNDASWIPDDMYVPNGQLDVSKIPLLSVDGRGLVNGGNCGVMLYAFRSDGSTPPRNFQWGASHPFGYPLSSTALSNQVAPVGFSVVPCPTRPGRKRFRFPGKKLAGRPLPFQSSPTWYGAVNSFSLRYNNPLSGVDNGDTASISFVVRFPKRSSPQSGTQFAWYASVGYPSLRVDSQGAAWMNYGITYLVPGFFASYVIFGSSRSLNLSQRTPSADECYTPKDGLPWVYLSMGTSTSQLSVPNYTSPGLDGDFFKFDTDRDYHIEIKLMKNGDKYTTRPLVMVIIDGVIVKNYWGTTDTDYSTTDAGDLDSSDRKNRDYLGAFQFNFQMNHWVGGSNSTTWFYPNMTEECGPMMISDVVFGAYPQADHANYAFGPTTRVWGESPNTDIKTSFKRPEGASSNASVVGRPMKVNTPETSSELSGTIGDSDEYKTDGSSMPDFAGTVLAVQLKTVARAESSDGTIVSTFDGKEVGEVPLSSSTGANYSTVVHTVEMSTPISPSEVAEKPFGFKVKEE